MALLVVPLGILLGWFVPSPRRAETATLTTGFGAFVVLSLLWGFTGVEVSTREPIILLLATPIAGALASCIARWRRSHRRSQVEAGDHRPVV